MHDSRSFSLRNRAFEIRVERTKDAICATCFESGNQVGPRFSASLEPSSDFAQHSEDGIRRFLIGVVEAWVRDAQEEQGKGCLAMTSKRTGE